MGASHSHGAPGGSAAVRGGDGGSGASVRASAPAGVREPASAGAAPASRRPGLGARPAQAGDAPPPGYELAGAAAARVAGAQALRPSRMRERTPPVAYPAPVQQEAVVKNVCLLKKQSLKVVRATRGDGTVEPDVYLVQFEFDSQVDGFVTVFYAASQTLVRDGNDKAARVEKVSFRGLQGQRPSKTRFTAGSDQKYKSKPSKGLNVKSYTESDLLYSAEGDRYPIVIRLEASYPPDFPVPEAKRVQMQATYATLTGPDAQGEYSCAIIKQEVLVAGTLYKMQELYGINGNVVGEVEDDGQGFTWDSSGNECVICLTEACTIAVRPCNHLCLCDDCGDVLLNDTNFERRRCPICRSPLGNLWRIIPKECSGEASEDGSGDTSASAEFAGATESARASVAESAPSNAPGADETPAEGATDDAVAQTGSREVQDSQPSISGGALASSRPKPPAEEESADGIITRASQLSIGTAQPVIASTASQQ